MYGVLIAEDELLVRLGLQNSISWNKYNMQVVGSAEDGQIAWDIYQQKKPEIVITDLRMPTMDGMELISRIRNENTGTKIVILTCVEEFETARKAIALGVQNYILKLSMSVEDMESILAKMKRELDQESTRDNNLISAQVGEDIIRERLLKGFLFYDFFSKDQFLENAKKCALRIEQRRLLLCIMEIDHYSELKSKDSAKRDKVVLSSITNIANSQMADVKMREIFYNDDGRYIILTNVDDADSDYSALKKALQNIGKTIGMYFGLSVTFAFSKIYDGFEKMPQMYQEAARALTRKFYLGKGKFLEEGTAIEGDYFRKIKEILQPLENGFPSVSVSKEYLWIQKSLTTAVLSRDNVVRMLSQLLQWINCSIFTCFTIDSSEDTTKYIHRLENCDTLDECGAAVKEFCQKVESRLPVRDFSDGIARAVGYIKSNYSHDITLSQLSQYVDMSSSYFSSVFKKETEYSFIEYLNMTRIEQAKKLLLQTDYKSYEIAERVGFSDNTYFCKVFKKATGISPIEFRENGPAHAAEGEAHEN